MEMKMPKHINRALPNHSEALKTRFGIEFLVKSPKCPEFDKWKKFEITHSLTSSIVNLSNYNNNESNKNQFYKNFIAK